MPIQFELPQSQIATYPAPERTQARMLCLDRTHHTYQDQHVYDLPNCLKPNDCLILNNTQVIPAQFKGRKATGGHIHCQVDQIHDDHQATLFIKSSHAPQPGDTVYFDQDLSAAILSKKGPRFTVRFNQPIQSVLNCIGQPPIPPYLKRTAEPIDIERYQTCFAKHPGAVAAPTAGLHFDTALLSTLNNQGVRIAELTLHVGAGTFEPINDTHLQSGRLHTESFEIAPELAQAWHETKSAGGRVITVDTTCVRALESAYASGQIQPQTSETDCFIRPGYAFKAIDGLLTNFHLPGSSLLYLVAAFIGTPQLEKTYQYAIQSGYRFYSYGDCMLML
ncbi:MAG: tRNA preQ1(34) S-adenosylmethionine ribosyltransferase-isomerase QueA [Legionellales bacterium]|nr:tRNA preQ1(34) S-adenosylmethionine ribosyltransferase-isomerase QueA [Legionellales bacterium]